VSITLCQKGEPFIRQIRGGNDSTVMFAGLCIDLMDRLSGLMGFTYTISLVADGQYGAFDEETNTWTGLVKDLVDQVCQLCNMAISH